MTVSDWLSTSANWAFLLISVPTLLAGLGVVRSRNVVRAALYLVVTLAGTAALFILLGAEFVGWTVILIYIGAVVILFLMGIMITRAPLGRETELSHPISIRIPAALLSLILFLLIGWAVVDAFEDEAIPVAADATRTADLGLTIFQRFVIPFEVVSVVLLAALIGGIAIARKDPEEETAS